MKVLIAPNAFKGTIDAYEAAYIIQKALKETDPKIETEISPIADGGDGTCFLLGEALGLPQIFQMALDPLGRPVEGFFSMDKTEQSAYLDVSTVSGIKYLKEYQRRPWIASTYGTGEMMVSAIKAGAKNIVLGLGGSATVDLGLGILRALGYLFLDANGREIPVFSEGYINRIAHIQRPLKSPDIRFTCLCDVNNHFYGKNGAIPVFGPQKGLQQDEIQEYQNACDRVIQLLAKKSGKEIEDREGFGAAGGIALGLSFFFPVEIQMGAQWFFEKINLESKVKNADLIFTGEGQYDSQSAGGKGSYELLQLAKKHNKKTVIITSGIQAQDSGFDEVIQLPNLDFEKEDFMEQAKTNLFEAIKKYY